MAWSSTQGFEKGTDLGEVGTRQIEIRHQAARLQMLRICNPGGEVARIVWERPRRDGLPSHEMAEIGSQDPPCARTAHGMARAAMNAKRRLAFRDRRRG